VTRSPAHDADAPGLVACSAGLVRFPDGTRVDLPALDVGAGERVAVVGPNGSGKSTLLRVLAGLEAAEPAPSRQPDVRVGHVGQRPFLFRTTVRENVRLGLPRGADESRRAAVDAALAALGIAALEHRPARTLSEGQQVRVAVARAVVARPDVLLLDEVFAALDPEGAELVARAVLGLDGAAVVAASPSPAALARLAPSRVVRLGGGAPAA
jgi:tungstate transport system ATP-binding protein